MLWSARDRVAEWGKREMPAHEWTRYYANRWVGVVEDSWLADHPAAWANCRGDATIPDHAEVVVAVDMALRRDSVAVVVAWKRPDGKVAVRPRIWATPADGKIDHLEVVDHIRGLARRYSVAEVVYDPRCFEVPARMLEDEGHNLVELPQSVERMAPACGNALQMIVAGDVVQDGDPDLTAHVTAAAIRPGERGFTLSKGRSKRKIDARIAMVIALTRVTAPVERKAEPLVMWR